LPTPDRHVGGTQRKLRQAGPSRNALGSGAERLKQSSSSGQHNTGQVALVHMQAPRRVADRSLKRSRSCPGARPNRDSLVDISNHLLECGWRDAQQAGVWQTEFEYEEYREGDAEGPECKS
jgi:hypothetical protein